MRTQGRQMLKVISCCLFLVGANSCNKTSGREALLTTTTTLTTIQICKKFVSDLGEPDAICLCSEESLYCTAKLDKWLLWLHCGSGRCDISKMAGAA